MSETFNEESLLRDARAMDGLEDFGDEAFREPLRVLLASLVEAPLNELGDMILRGTVVRSLANRLRIEHWLAQYPDIARERIEAPLVIVGMMRSGTTLVQRLLAQDPDNYFTLGWEAMEPAPRLAVEPGAPDPRIASAEKREKQSRTFAPDLFAIHPSYAHEAEEEIMFLADAFLSHVPESYCNLPVYRTWLNEQDFTPAYRHLYRTLQLLQWQKKRRGACRQRWVLKTPAHLGYLDILLDTFPDAHVIHMHRDPLDTIPSGASLNATLWRMHQDRVDPTEVGRQWLERMAWTNHRAMGFRERCGEDTTNFSDLRFRDAVRDPIQAAQRIYDRAGLELTGPAQAAMATWLARNGHESLQQHVYTAGDFGLLKNEITETFAAYTGRFLAGGA